MTATVISLAERPSALPPRMTPEERDRALHAELRRARIRLARLEASLGAAVREALAQKERARAAERRLAEITGLRDRPSAIA